MKKTAIRIVFMLILAVTLTGFAQAGPEGDPKTRPPGSRRDLNSIPRLQTGAPIPQAKFPTAPADVFDWSKLTFQSVRDANDWEIFTADGDGSNQLAVTSNSAQDIWPSFNRGATQIAFSTNRDGNYEIYTMNANGTGQTRRTNVGSNDYDPDWSPDGSKIAFTATRNDPDGDIFVMTSTGGSQTRLTTNADTDDYPAWSPDGSKIAFTSYRNGQWRIWVMDANGQNQVQRSNQAYSEEPAWSPDGSQIAFDADADGDGWQELWVMNADGSNQHMLWDPPSAYTSAWARSWSPDGRFIAFTLINFVYVDPDWYWQYAFPIAYDTTNGNTYYLSNTGTDWNPDWVISDLQAPSSSVIPLPGTSPATFTVSWSGVDNGTAGIKNYDLQVRDGPGGTWTDWLAATTATSAQYSGLGGHTYYFRSRARDDAGNLEAYPADYDAFTTVETLAPTSFVDAMPPFVNHTPFLVTWSGSDPGGSGIQSYDVQVRDGFSGAWTDWQVGVTSHWADYPGVNGHTYYFRSRARDYAGNLETYPPDFDAYTLVDTRAPTSAVGPLPPFSRSPVHVQWSGDDSGGAGIQFYEVQYRQDLGGAWTDWQIGTTSTSADFTGTPGHVYYFRSRARDFAGNQEAYPAGDGDAFTTIYAWGISGAVTDNSGVPVNGATPAITPPSGAVQPSDDTGAYAAYLYAIASQYTLNWSKSGYGALPDTQFNSGNDAHFDVVLPPADNLVKNWGFESGVFGAEDWQASGVVVPVVTSSPKHTGEFSAQLGELPTAQDLLAAEKPDAVSQTGNSSLSQQVTLPITMTQPTLSFLYRLGGASTANHTWLDVQVQQGITVTTLVSITTETSGVWTHRWFDLSTWAGKTVTLTFNVHETEGQPPAYAVLDEVTIGAARPDLWVRKSASAPTALPGETVNFTLTYGNRGVALASGVRITDTLPAELTFVSASVTPLSTTPALVWDFTSLAPGSGPETIVITATLGVSATPFSTVTNPVEIGAQTFELELANNQSSTGIFVGKLVYLPLAQRP
jgi:uncharacterized repeat protein (TIGR01451 family)